MFCAQVAPVSIFTETMLYASPSYAKKREGLMTKNYSVTNITLKSHDHLVSGNEYMYY